MKMENCGGDAKYLITEERTPDGYIVTTAIPSNIGATLIDVESYNSCVANNHSETNNSNDYITTASSDDEETKIPFEGTVQNKVDIVSIFGEMHDFNDRQQALYTEMLKRGTISRRVLY